MQVPLELEGLVKPYVVKTLPVSGVKVGIVGLTTQETEQLEVAGKPASCSCSCMPKLCPMLSMPPRHACFARCLSC